MIGPLRLILLLALGAYVLGRPRTRSPGGLAVVAITAALVFLIEASYWEWALLAEGLVYGIAGALVYWEPSWMRAHPDFAADYEAVDGEVWQELMQAEHDWRAGRIDDIKYSRAFDRSNVRYRALHPPPGVWRDIIDERIRIREEWSRIFADPSTSTQAKRDALGAAEADLRERIARAR